MKNHSHLLPALITILQRTPPARLNKNLRKMFMLYALLNYDSIPKEFGFLIEDLIGLFDFLDRIEEEISPATSKQQD